MMKYILLIFALAAGVLAKEKEELIENSIVTIEVNRKVYDYLQPWTRRVEQVQKAGVVISAKEILTTAEFFGDQTLVRLQKGGSGKWWKGETKWVDYHANLAIVEVADGTFWNGLKPLKIGDAAPAKGEVQIARWRNGNLDLRRAEVSRLSLKKSRISFMEYLQMEIDTEAPGLGWSDAVLNKGKLVGLACSKEEHGCSAIPSSFIQHCLKGSKSDNYRGLGYFGFVWQRGENPATLDYLKLKGDAKGAIIIDVPLKEPGTELQPRDVILEVDGFKIDTQGNYKDPAYGNVSLENLATRQHWAGDELKFKVWRDGKPLDVKYRLPKIAYDIELVPQELFDREPEYVLLGGLLFQALSEPYLRSWGADWNRKAPFRLSYYAREKPQGKHTSLIVLSLVLPDPINLGYQDSRYLAVDQVNKQKIRSLTDLMEAIKKPENGFHTLEFRDGDSLKRMVLDANDLDRATQRIQQRYGIPKSSFIAESPVPKSRVTAK
jgi:hypothetical protein